MTIITIIQIIIVGWLLKPKKKKFIPNHKEFNYYPNTNPYTQARLEQAKKDKRLEQKLMEYELKRKNIK